MPVTGLSWLLQLSFNAKSIETLYINMKQSFLVVQTHMSPCGELANTQNTFSLFAHPFCKIPPCCKEGCLVSGLPFSFVILARSHVHCLQMSTSWLFTAELSLHGSAVLGGEPQQAPHCHLGWEPEIGVSPSRSTNLCLLATEDPQGPV